VLYECVVEADERVVLISKEEEEEAKEEEEEEERQRSSATEPARKRMKRNIITGSNGAPLFIETELDEVSLRKQLEEVRSKGITSVAVVLCHSYAYSVHEERCGAIAKEIGFTHVSLSCHTSSSIRMVIILSFFFFFSFSFFVTYSLSHTHISKHDFLCLLHRWLEGRRPQSMPISHRRSESTYQHLLRDLTTTSSLAPTTTTIIIIIETTNTTKSLSCSLMAV
jgi:hypothetical protein